MNNKRLIERMRKADKTRKHRSEKYYQAFIDIFREAHQSEFERRLIEIELRLKHDYENNQRIK